MKFSYLVAAFFVVCTWFSCADEQAVETITDFKIVTDTIITFDPETYAESIETITYKISADGKDTLERTTATLKSNQAVEESIQIVKDEKTGAIDTIITVSFTE
ncbi:MAG: hypothetical protein AAF806_24635 [Bacteroidota bacterium]